MLEPYINGTETFLNTITLSDAHIFNSLFTGNSSVRLPVFQQYRQFRRQS